MKQEHIKQIISYYDKAGEYRVNEQYSGEQGTVYIKENDKYHWLVLEQKDINKAEIRQTDGYGRIIARDTYEIVRNTVKCTGLKRLKASGRGMVCFSAEEVSLMNQFGVNSKQAMLASVKAIEPEIADNLARIDVRSIIHKLSVLSE